jgi:hypothetical protein
VDAYRQNKLLTGNLSQPHQNPLIEEWENETDKNLVQNKENPVLEIKQPQQRSEDDEKTHRKKYDD